ncbi:lasso peptide biosynthesis PqqD family chaperone [Streptomyces sp. NPDC050703]|uniref:lasso peptide biosynthesis PqqD family chaperone n=1 Tax=Streptomyces sp. NPDC050703 TaxID=3157218 RepID=UPI0034267F43
MHLRLRDNVSIVRTEYGSVLLDERGGVYFQLNPTGTIVAEGLDHRLSPAAIAERLMQEYDVDEEQAMKDIAALVEKLQASDLVQP